MAVTMRQKTPVNMLVRTDSTNPAGRLHAFLHKKRDSIGLAETENELAATRYCLGVQQPQHTCKC